MEEFFIQVVLNMKIHFHAAIWGKISTWLAWETCPFISINTGSCTLMASKGLTFSWKAFHRSDVYFFKNISMKFILWVSSSSHVQHNSEQPAKLADLACFLDLVREGGAPKVVSVHNAHVAKLLLGLLFWSNPWGWGKPSAHPDGKEHARWQ